MKQFLIVPSRPTPNGPLHLGHIGGPYLRADVLKRALLREGHAVHMVSGVDAYESYLEVAVAKDGRPHATVVHEAFRRIEQDLRSFDISFDAFFDVSQRPGQLDEAIAQLFSRIPPGKVVERHETVPVDAATDAPLAAAAVSGRCRRCGAGITGFICETCGAVARLNEHVEPRGPGEEPLQWRPRSHFYLEGLEAAQVAATLRRKGTPARYVAQVERLLDALDTAFPLSYPVAATAAGPRWLDKPQQLVYSGATGLAYAWLFGQAWCEMTGNTVNPFAGGSQVCTVATFGRDALMLYLYSANLVEHHCAPSRRGFDRYLANDFLCLEGKKFSTSRRHAIWASEAARDSGVPVDAWRWFLCTIDMESFGCDFRMVDFERFLRDDYAAFLSTLLECIGLVQQGDRGTTSATLIEMHAQFKADQAASLDLDGFHPARAARTLSAWARVARQGNGREAWDWLRGAAALAWPFMPQLAQRIATATGMGPAPVRWPAFPGSGFTTDDATLRRLQQHARDWLQRAAKPGRTTQPPVETSP